MEGEQKQNAWLVRPKPHGIDRMGIFKASNIIAVGWPGIGDLSGKSRENLKKILSGAPYHYDSLKLGNSYSVLDIFVNLMEINDLVLIPDGDDIHFAQIVSDYQYASFVDNSTSTGGYPHQREVKWLVSTVREKLSKELRKSLKVHRTAAGLSHHLNEIDCLAHGGVYIPPTSDERKENEEEREEKKDCLRLSYPLRPDFTITFAIPKDITREEAQRLAAYFGTLYFS